jgi:Zn-finger nucleic acid-binding protein
MDLICPVCGKTMVEQDFGGVKVHVCDKGCKGLYFDWLQLQKLDHKNQGFGDALQAALKNPLVNDENRPRLHCPKCQLWMYRHEFDLDKEVNVDECYGCGGFFLDSGELNQIRDHSMSAQEEQTYLNKFVEDMPEIKEMEQQEVKDTQRADAVAHFTRFLRLSYYATGH